MSAFTDDQQSLRDMAMRFVERECTFAQRRSMIQSPEARTHDKWQRLAELGFLGLHLPETVGGQGGCFADSMAVLDALAPALMLEPLIAHVTAVELIYKSDVGRASTERLKRMLGGEYRVVVAIEEVESRYELACIATRASPDRLGYMIVGAKSAVLGFDASTHIVLLARLSEPDTLEEPLALFWIPRTTAGLRVWSYGSVDGQGAADIRIDACVVPAEYLIAQGKTARLAAERAVDLGAAATCADAMGVVRAALRETALYLKARKQFGQPIASFQALQHRIADMAIAARRLESAVDLLRQRVEGADSQERKRLVSAAKAQVGRCGRFVTEQAVQLHGGIGITEEHVIGHYLKRLTALTSVYGDTEFHLERFADLTQGVAAVAHKSMEINPDDDR